MVATPGTGMSDTKGQDEGQLQEKPGEITCLKGSYKGIKHSCQVGNHREEGS